MKAIEKTDAFVLEIHPDSISVNFDTEQLYLTNLTKAQKDRVIEKMKALNYGEIDSALLLNAAFVSAIMTPDYSKPDDMPTFVDAYLYGIAKTLRKKFYGLEDGRTQLSSMYSQESIDALFEGTEEEAKTQTEKMIEVYARGNINEIWDFVEDEGDKMDELEERNHIMVSSLKELLKNQSVFATVGTAHLPGDIGLINLLRKEGYKLRPVTATFNGVAKTYQTDYAKMEWYNFKDPKFNYTVDFPSFPKYKEEIYSGATLTDLISNATYTVAGRYIGNLNGLTQKQYVDTVAAIVISNTGAELIDQKDKSIDGADATEIVYQMRNKFGRAIFIYKNKNLYSLNVESEKDQLKGYFVDHFFESFKAGEEQKYIAGEWINYSNDTAGFTIKLPVLPEKRVRELTTQEHTAYNPYRVNLYLSVDKALSFNYIIRYNDYPEGLYLTDRNLLFNSIIAEMAKTGKQINEPKVIYKDDVEGRAVDFLIEGGYAETQIYIKGNRTYLLLKQNVLEDQKAADNEFFTSFNFTAPKIAPVVKVESDGLTINMPGKPYQMPADEEDNESYIGIRKVQYSTNEYTGGLYGIQSGKVSKYYRSPSQDSLMIGLLESFLVENDSEPQYSDLVNKAGIKAKEMFTTDSVAKTQKKIRVWLNKDHAYVQVVIADKSEIEGQQARNFFNEITQKTAPGITTNIHTSKADLILNDLKSSDTTSSKAAFGALGFYKFDDKELPALRKAIKVKYSDDTTTYYGARFKLMRELYTLKDLAAVKEFKEIYNDNTNAGEIRIAALSLIPELDKSNLDWYLNTLVNDPVIEIENYWTLFSPLTDSLEYASKNLPKLTGLLDKDNYRLYIMNVISNMVAVEERPKYIELLLPYKDQICQKAMSDLDRYITEIKDEGANHSLIYRYLSVLPEIGLKELTNEFTTKVFTIDSVPDLRNEALSARIRAGLPLDDAMLKNSFETLSLRYSTLHAYYKSGKWEQIPQQYRSPEEISRLLLYNYVMEDFDEVDEITVLGTITEESGTYYVLEFKITDGEEVSTYIGIAGSFGADATKIDFLKINAYSDFEPKEEDWKAQAKAMIATFENEES